MRPIVIGALSLLGIAVAVGVPWWLFRAWKMLRPEISELGNLRNSLARFSVVATGLAYLSLAGPVAAAGLYRAIGDSPRIPLGRLLWQGLPLMWLGITGAISGLCAAGPVRIGLVASAGTLVILGLGFAAMR